MGVTGATGAVGVTRTWSDIQLEVGSEDTDYESFIGSTLTATIPTPPGTVYGAQLDLVSGVLTVTWAIISKKYSELTSVSGTPPAGFAYLSYGRLPSTGDYQKRASTLCNLCSYNDNGANPNVIRMTSSGNYLYATLPIGLDPDTEVTAVYPLATPVTYQLTRTDTNYALTSSKHRTIITGDITAVGVEEIF